MLVEIRASRVVELDAANAEEAIERAEEAAFPGSHRRDKIKSMVAPGFPKRSASGRKRKPSVGVPS